MVDDPLRTRPLLNAIRKVVRPGDIVIDIGTGLGILAIAAADAGAERVYAIDCDAEAIAYAKSASKKEGLDDFIEFIEGLSFHSKIDEKADLIICETVGSFAFDEGILTTLKDAKERFLKPNGRIIPRTLELWGAPLLRLPKISYPSETASVFKTDLAAKPELIEEIDLLTNFSKRIRKKTQFECIKQGVIPAFAMWPKVTWWDDEITDASPLLPQTHWKQGILPIEARDIDEGDVVKFECLIEPHPEEPLTMTERLWRWAD
jgi:predicted RNA methylase